MNLVKIGDIVVNLDHVTAITPVAPDGCYLRVAGGDAFRVNCSVSDLVRFLEMLEFDVMKIDIKREQVARKEKTGS